MASLLIYSMFYVLGLHFRMKIAATPLDHSTTIFENCITDFFKGSFKVRSNTLPSVTEGDLRSAPVANCFDNSSRNNAG